MKSFKAITFGVSAGYMYTFVFQKGFFISLAAVPGVGYRFTEVENLHNERFSNENIALNLLGRISIGYNRHRYFLNFNTNFNLRNYDYDKYELSLSSEQLKLTFGIRFITKASIKIGQFYPEKKR